ncbi:MAG: hypothetical protein Ct9H300mP27_02230 [Chloroflexota bacterium]|nr:MAG: hypothetical protein Ct9H300mP27_02230 [Chloroflexota bacterium]
MIPIGRGQREFLLGIGRPETRDALGCHNKPKGWGPDCIYVHRQKQGKVAQVVGILEEAGAMEHTIFVNAGAADSAPLQFIAPFSRVCYGRRFYGPGQGCFGSI